MFFSFLQNGYTPSRSSLRAKSYRFSLLGRVHRFYPLLAKNQRLHYCNLASNFLHHEAGEFWVLSHRFIFDKFPQICPKSLRIYIKLNPRKVRTLKNVVVGWGGRGKRWEGATSPFARITAFTPPPHKSCKKYN